MILAGLQFFFVEKDKPTYILGHFLPKSYNCKFPFLSRDGIYFKEVNISFESGIPKTLKGYKTGCSCCVVDDFSIKDRERVFRVLTGTASITAGKKIKYNPSLPIYFATLLRYTSLSNIQNQKNKEIVTNTLNNINLSAQELLEEILELCIKPRQRFLQETFDWLYRFNACQVRGGNTIFTVRNNEWRLLLHLLLLDLDVLFSIGLNVNATIFSFRAGSLKYALTQNINGIKLATAQVVRKADVFTRDLVFTDIPIEYYGNNLFKKVEAE